MRSGRAILLASAAAVVVAASAWVVPEARSFLRDVPAPLNEPSAVVKGAVVRVETVLATPAEMPDRRTRPADRHRVPFEAVVALPVLIALAVLWRRPGSIGSRASGRVRGRAVASRAPPPSAILRALA